MQRSVIIGALAAAVGAAGWCGSASAQVGVEFYAGPSATYDSYYGYRADPDYRYGSQVYTYHYGPTYRRDRRPEDYRAGSNRWWKEMDRRGRAGGSN